MTKKKDIEFLRVTHLGGPNIWTYRPVIEVWVDIGALEDFPSNTIPGFYERLTTMLPTLAAHRCGIGQPGGFLERLREGTWAGHILEHVVLELQNLSGMQTGFGKARQTSERGIYKVAFRTRQEQVGRKALHAARDLVMAAIEERPYDVDATVAELRDMVDSLCLGPSTAHIVDAATERRIPSIRLNDGNLVQFGHGARQRRIWTAETDQTSAVAESISSDKDLTKSLLSSCGIPVPEGRMVASVEEAWEAAQDIGLPVAVKPYDGNHGRGVSLDLSAQKDIEAAYHLADSNGNGIIVEQFIAGNEHRLLVVGDRVVAAARGETAWVTGDGKSNIIELVNQQINTDPRRGTGEAFPLNVVTPDDDAEVILELGRQGFTAESVPAANAKILIQRNGNVAFDVTDDVHPSVAATAALAARVVGLDIAGIDLVAEDITRPLDEQRGAIIEVNAGPGLLSHLKPANGEARPVGEAIIDHLFAPDDSGRIPVVGVTGTQDTTFISRLIAWLLHTDGKYVGLACTDGLFLNRRQVIKGNCANWEAGQRLLINRSVEAAVFENGSRMILTEGLAYDKCTVGVVTDMRGHEQLGEFYIHEVDQHFNVVRTQVDVVLPDGVAVLNAADAEVVKLAELCDGKVIFYGADPDSDAIAAHRAKGERVAFLRDRAVILAVGSEDAATIPLSFLDSNKTMQPESVLAAAAAAWALGIGPELIVAGLKTFDLNPGKTIY